MDHNNLSVEATKSLPGNEQFEQPGSGLEASVVSESRNQLQEITENEVSEDIEDVSTLLFFTRMYFMMFLS